MIRERPKVCAGFGFLTLPQRSDWKRKNVSPSLTPPFKRIWMSASKSEFNDKIDSKVSAKIFFAGQSD